MSETQRNILHLIVGFLLFPVMVLGVVPGVLVHFYGFELPHPTHLGYWFAKVLLPAGFVTIGWTVALFFVHGHGTPAPWAPPKRLVVLGAYQYVRNPMMLGVLMMLLGEALILSSAAIAIWFTAVLAVVHLMIVFYEEPGLKRRFGDDYARYQANVRRWIPRFSAWTPPTDDSATELHEDGGEADPWKGYDPNRNKP